jgi:hypothetical protein
MVAFSEAYHNTAPKGSLLRAVAALLNRLALDNLNSVFIAAGCATATTTSKAKFANTVTYMTDGAFHSLTTQDNFWTPNGPVLNAGATVVTANKYLLCVNSAGAATVVAGNPAPTLAAVTFTATPDALAIFGVLSVVTNAATTFTPGTTLLGAGGITSTFNDGPGLNLTPILADMTSGAEILEANGGNTQFYLG